MARVAGKRGDGEVGGTERMATASGGQKRGQRGWWWHGQGDSDERGDSEVGGGMDKTARWANSLGGLGAQRHVSSIVRAKHHHGYITSWV